MAGTASRTSFLWLEITGRCQLECQHCYAESGPSGTHGAMSTVDWLRVLDQAAALGVQTVQFIGGEPTLHPDLPRLVNHGLRLGLAVEVFTNLVHVTDELWELFAQPGLSLATSYYSDDPAEHAGITGRPSHPRTKANIAEAIRRGIPLRAGVIDLGGRQRAEAAQVELTELGVTAIGYDRLRQVGRGIRDQHAGSGQLCGRCGDGVAAISPDGAVWPCVFSRWLSAGSVLDAELTAILSSPAAARIRGELATAFASRTDRPAGARPCYPDCNPACQPNCAPRCSPTCNPTSCRPNACWPQYRSR